MKAAENRVVPVDFQEHLARLEEAAVCSCASTGRSTRIPSCIRSCAGSSSAAIPRRARRAFLFTNVVGSQRRALRHARSWWARWPPPTRSTPWAWASGRGAGRHLDAARSATRSRPECSRERALPRGGHHRRGVEAARRRPRAPSGADLDAGFRCRALSHRDGLRHQGSRNRRAEHGHLSRRPEGVGPARRAHGVAPRRRGRLPALAEISEARRADALRHRGRLRAGRRLYGPAETRRSTRTRWRSRAGSPGGRCASRAARPSTSKFRPTPRSSSRADRHRLLEPEGPFGESHGHVALEDFNMSMRVTAITHKQQGGVHLDHQRGDASESSVLKKSAYEALYLPSQGPARGARHQEGRDARAADQSAQGALPAIRARRAADRSVARPAGRRHACRRNAARSSSRCRRTSTRATPTRCSGRSPTAPIPVEDVLIVPYRSGGHGPKSGGGGDSPC